jgi:hypothetical protein
MTSESAFKVWNHARRVPVRDEMPNHWVKPTAVGARLWSGGISIWAPQLQALARQPRSRMRAKLLAMSLVRQCTVAACLALMAGSVVMDGRRWACRRLTFGLVSIGDSAVWLGALVSTAFTCVAWVANRRWLPRAVSSTPRTPGWLAGGLGAVILLAGLAGSVQFVTRKPFF